MINNTFLRETYSQYRIKALENELEQFKSGEKYISMKEAHRKEVQALRSENKKLAEQLAQARRTTKEVREKWFSTCDELDRNDRRELEKAFRQIEMLKQKCFEAEMKRFDDMAALEEKYEAKLEEKQAVIEDLENQLKHARALLNRDGTNTSLPTSQTPPGKKKVNPRNSREKTGRKKGGQKGHEMHTLEAPAEELIDSTQEHRIDPDEESCPDCGGNSFIFTGEKEVHYETDVEVIVHRTKHVFYIYQCADCGATVRTSQAPDFRCQVQYGPNIQAIALSMLDTVNASMNKIPLFLSAVTNGQVRPSEGFIASLPKRASKGLAAFKKELRLLLLTRRIVYWDDTVISILAKRACLRFYGDERISYYTAHKSKGMNGLIEDRILEYLTEDTHVMHDHNKVNYNKRFRFKNLECCQHLERDLQKSADETQHEEMQLVKKLIADAIKERNKLFAEGIRTFSKDYIAEFDTRLEELLSGAEAKIKEHFNRYSSRDEMNVIERIRDYHNNFFAWMSDFTLPHTDNLSERQLRTAKTKKKVSGQFESEEAAMYYADILTYTRTCRQNGINEIYALSRLTQGNPITVKEIFPEFDPAAMAASG